jgi:hypothetical protein
MSKRYTPNLTITDARRLRSVLDAADVSTSGALESSISQNGGAVVVEIREDIAADDLDQHYVSLMRLNGGEFVDTLQTVPVRNVSRVGITASEEFPVRVIAKHVSNLGLCIDIQFVGSELIQFQPTDVCEGIGLTCDCVTATVLTASCGSSVEPGDVVQVWDQSRGWFQMPEALLFASVGWAHKVKVTEADQYDLPFDVGPCRYVVISMDCIEQEPA